MAESTGKLLESRGINTCSLSTKTLNVAFNKSFTVASSIPIVKSVPSNFSCPFAQLNVPFSKSNQDDPSVLFNIPAFIKEAVNLLQVVSLTTNLPPVTRPYQGPP